MHTSYAPDVIDEDYIENCCNDLRCDLLNVFHNTGEFQQEMYDAASRTINHISAMLDDMIQDY